MKSGFVGLFVSLMFPALLMTAVPPAAAQTCTKSDISSVVDSTAARLRRLNASHQPELQSKLRQLGERRGWSDDERDAKAAEFIEDNETRALDEQASRLLIEFDALGDETSLDPGSCRDRLERLNTVSAQLIEITTAKAAHVTARIDAALAQQATPSRSAARPPPAKTEPKTESAAIDPAPAQPSSAQAPKAQGRGGPNSTQPSPQTWETDTVRHPPPREAVPPLAPERHIAGLPPRLSEPEELEFTAEEIYAAGRGFFGSISAGLASVIEYAFQSYGRPNGYILGSEGGAALLAGLRYGDGRLVTKRAGERNVFWQGPSVGTDVGLAGSRVMFLVYNLREQDELFARFAGIDGSAYLVGGVGITFLKKGRLVLAPIRTGLGLRVGANLGYLKFTPEPSINPF